MLESNIWVDCYYFVTTITLWSINILLKLAHM